MLSPNIRAGLRRNVRADGAGIARPRSATGDRRRPPAGRRSPTGSGRSRPGKASQGGLAVAMRAALEETGGLWFGFSGYGRRAARAASRNSTTAGKITAATLDLTRRDFEEYYIGYANRVLWPLFHYRPSLVGFSRRDLAGYVRVNRRFARALQPMLHAGRPGLGARLPSDPVRPRSCGGSAGADRSGSSCTRRSRRPRCCGCCPTTASLSRRCAPMIWSGFQTVSDLARVPRLSAALGRRRRTRRAARSALSARVVRAGVFPVGIDVEAIAAQAEAAEKSRHMRRLRDSIRDRALLIGVDRLDYSKGLPARFEAYAHLLEHYPQTRGRTVFLQIAPPSRSDVPEYREIRQHAGSRRRQHQRPLRRIRLDAAALSQQELQSPHPDRVLPGGADRAW